MTSSLFGSALSGMNAAQAGLSTAQHNITNAVTPGFNRQEILLSARPGQQTGSGFIGQGVEVTGVRRIYDQFLSAQVLQEQTQASYFDSYRTAISQIDNLLADPDAGASPAMQAFFGAMNSVANFPESTTARQTLLSGAQFVVNRFQAIDQRLTNIADGLNGQITSSVSAINTYAQQIATLNTNIKRAIASGQNGQLPNDLMDQREQIINQMNREIRVSTQIQSDGAVNLFIGSGQALVIGEQAMSLRTTQSPVDPSKLEIAYQNGSNLVSMQQSSLQGGNLGAYLTFRDQTLEPARNALGRVALGLATHVNQQNQLGQDLYGNLGGNIFSVASPSVDKGAFNNGNAIVSAAISDVGALTTSNYQLRYDGSNYTMLRLSDNTVTNLGATLPQTVDGFAVSLTSGTPAAGDSFLIRPTVHGARDLNVSITDPAKIAAAAPMRTAATLANTGNGQISAGEVVGPPPTDANLQATVTITFTSSTTFTVSGAVPAVVGAVAYTPGQDISYNGWIVQISGAPATGDVFTVSKNTNAVGDNRNALQMANLQTQNLMANGNSSLQGIYDQLVGEMGARTYEMNVNSRAQDNMVAQLVTMQQSVSGVNLDEEAANLIRYQRAYQASAKAMQVSNTLFESLLSLGR